MIACIMSVENPSRFSCRLRSSCSEAINRFCSSGIALFHLQRDRLGIWASTNLPENGMDKQRHDRNRRQRDKDDPESDRQEKGGIEKKANEKKGRQRRQNQRDTQSKVVKQNEIHADG